MEHFKTRYCHWLQFSPWKHQGWNIKRFFPQINDFSPQQLCVLQLSFPYKKHFMKTLSGRESNPLPSAQPSNITPTSSRRQKRLFDIPHHKWNVFRAAGPAPLLPCGLIPEYLCSIFMQSTLIKEPLIIKWLALLYTEVSCYQLIYALLILTRYSQRRVFVHGRQRY